MKNTIGAYIGDPQRDIGESMSLSAYVQRWSDLLEVDYFAINDLILPFDETLSIEQRIDKAVKIKFANAFKKISVMAKVLGSKAY